MLEHDGDYGDFAPVPLIIHSSRDYSDEMHNDWRSFKSELRAVASR